ncbi:MAG: hypothetical protein DWQ02_23995 [Bacteroidetes bacterium]|nr:MAG: hypothetical protein DWQ02_23995 [Bacteroidota bacterium]
MFAGYFLGCSEKKWSHQIGTPLKILLFCLKFNDLKMDTEFFYVIKNETKSIRLYQVSFFVEMDGINGRLKKYSKYFPESVYNSKSME